MKPPSLQELARLAQRLDESLIAKGLELSRPIDQDRVFLVGGEYVRAEGMVRRLVRRCLELQRFIENEHA